MRHRFLPGVLLCTLVLALAPAKPAAAQADVWPPDPIFGERVPRWAGHVGVLGVNALLGGITAGTSRWLRGGSFSEAFARGAAGGAGTFAGKLIAAQDTDGAGLVGRQVGAVASSVTRNAAEGAGAFDLVSLPVGPLWVHLGPGERDHARVTLDLHSAGWLAYAARQPELRWDPGASLSAGAPVFSADAHRIFWGDSRFEVSGLAPAGLIILRNTVLDSPESRLRTAAHERVHVIQHDNLHLTVLDPIERWALGRTPALRGVLRYVEPGVIGWIGTVVGVPIPYEENPWEIEARFLSGQPR